MTAFSTDACPFLTKLGSRLDSPAMIRKVLAVVVVGSWVALSAIDMLEDLDLASYLKIHTAENSEFAGFGPGAAANNAVENGARHVPAREVNLISASPNENFGFRPHDKEAKGSKNLKIYKLDRAFLI